MATGLDEPKFQNMVSLAMQLLAWIPSVKKKKKEFNFIEKLAKKRFQCKGWSIWNTNVCL